MPVFSFYCLFVIGGTSTTVVNIGGEVRSFVWPDFNGKSFNVFPLGLTLALRLRRM